MEILTKEEINKLSIEETRETYNQFKKKLLVQKELLRKTDSSVI